MPPHRACRMVVAVGLAVALSTAWTVPLPVEAARGSITIVNDAKPDSGHDFSYSTSGTGLSAFRLDDDADPRLPRRRSFTGLAAGTYTIRQAADDAWWLGNLTCNRPETIDLARRKVVIHLTAGEAVVCTFVDKKLGSITIEKEVLGAVAGPGAQDFDFVAAGDGVSGFQLDDDQDSDAQLPDERRFARLRPGAYTFTEELEPGFVLTDLTCTTGETPALEDRQVEVQLQPGERVRCTFENATTGSITIRNETDLAGPPQYFDFQIAPSEGDIDFIGPLRPNVEYSLSTGSSRTFTDLPAGNTYDVTELTQPGWDLDEVQCDPAQTVAGTTASITVEWGTEASCTFRNNPTEPHVDAGAITIVEDAQPNDGADFAHSLVGPGGERTLVLDDDASPERSNTATFTNLASGSYAITQGVVPDWELTAITCDPEQAVDLGARRATVDLQPNETVTCTFVDQAVPAGPSLTWGPNGAPGTFDYVAAGPGGQTVSRTLACVGDPSGGVCERATITDPQAGTWTITQTGIDSPDAVWWGIQCESDLGTSTWTDDHVFPPRATIHYAAGDSVFCQFLHDTSGGAG